MDLNDLKKLIKVFETSNLHELEVEEKDGHRILMKKEPAAQIVTTREIARPAALEEAAMNMEASAPPAPAPASAPVEEVKITGHVITSPMVGTFYRAPSPTSPQYVDIGDHVRKGQVLCLVEAMKLMNEIESDIDGKVVRIFPENGKPVEYGQHLFEITPS